MTPGQTSQIAKRAAYINGTPFAHEGLRLAKLLERISALANEGAIMGGGGGFDDILLDIAANAVAWLEVRASSEKTGIEWTAATRALRDQQGQIAAAEIVTVCAFLPKEPSGGQGGI